MIAVELCVLGLIWALWLANGVVAVHWIQVLYPFGCSDLPPFVVPICHEFHVIEGLSFASGILRALLILPSHAHPQLVWIVVIYSGILLCFAMVGRSHGNQVWTVAVSQANFSAPSKEDIIGAGTQLPGNHIGSVVNPYVVGSGPISGVSPTTGYMTQQAFIAPLAAGPQQRPPYPEV
ncbi:hypothetical protein BD779DRAFT_1493794 [Infundibulicybe gibba]|nr:hypothetical protein BD779DRAFT_1493794 [Infundibulicybe gibba]